MHAQIFSDSCSCIFGGSIRGITKMPEFELRDAFMTENRMETLEDSGVAQWERIRLIT